MGQNGNRGPSKQHFEALGMDIQWASRHCRHRRRYRRRHRRSRSNVENKMLVMVKLSPSAQNPTMDDTMAGELTSH
ncbi:hypothetical protein [Absidia glauca]|uniref:Uncharacterized protein n=1 Tax=Absidia glauca TaxID=4829 RepID=A0A168P1M0_ABSGL|nr:hypothetical protein [Absidia glauca]